MKFEDHNPLTTAKTNASAQAKTTMTEEWREIPSFTKYEASTFGNIRNKKKMKLMVTQMTASLELGLNKHAIYKAVNSADKIAGWTMVMELCHGLAVRNN